MVTDWGGNKGLMGNGASPFLWKGGRVKNSGGFQLKTALKEIAELVEGQFILTGNQNVIIANLSDIDKKVVNERLKANGVAPGKISGLRKNSIACVALNTCPLAFAEAERYLPTLVSKIEGILDENQLGKEEIVIRMTGCPNGCGRPYLAEIGFVGKSLGHYNLYLGGSFVGDRLNTLYKETLNEEEILKELKPIIADYAENKKSKEHFGDFVIRKGYVKATLVGADFRH